MPLKSLAVGIAFATLLSSCGSNPPATKPNREHEVTLGSTAPRPHNQVRSPKPNTQKPARKTPPPVAGRPEITEHPIPFNNQRVLETAAYSQRHYGRPVTRLDPKVIVEHYTVTATAQAAFEIFARDVPDVELHELPGVCSHFVVDRDGTIFQLVPLRLICRHTVGLNDVAIGIEHVGSSDAAVLNNPPQLKASIRLTNWLRCRYEISISNVIGHAESLSSPYHHENVAALRSQTHSDFQPRSMNRYRSLLKQRSC